MATIARAAPAFDAPVKCAQREGLAFGEAQDGFPEDLPHGGLGPRVPSVVPPAEVAEGT
ncbi:MAG: hypothetical protein ABIZ56_11445 [Chthoniobacteraceae bacterium]